jgi:hypothetical protein
MQEKYRCVCVLIWRTYGGGESEGEKGRVEGGQEKRERRRLFFLLSLNVEIIVRSSIDVLFSPPSS